MARYLGTLLSTVPPKSWMRASTAGVTSARMSTVTTASSASVVGACLSLTPAPGACRRATPSDGWALPVASRSWELSFRWAGVRCAFGLQDGRNRLAGRLGTAEIGPHQDRADRYHCPEEPHTTGSCPESCHIWSLHPRSTPWNISLTSLQGETTGETRAARRRAQSVGHEPRVCASSAGRID